jgi:hypothetical protein
LRLPGYDDNYIHERSEPQGLQRTCAFGSVEWAIENQKALAACKAVEAREERQLARLAAFLANKS